MVFELMNEPHDLDINIWAATCQKAVTGIRNAGATSQMILLPGTNFASAATLVSSGSAAVLMNITNVDGTTDNLLLDIHKYLDEDNSGTHATCTTDNVDAFTTVAQFLRQAGRKGMISESGASQDSTVRRILPLNIFRKTLIMADKPQCLTNFCSQNTFINRNADVFAGLVGWGAGSFDTSYILSLTPSTKNNQLVDNTLMQRCMIDVWASASPRSTSRASSQLTVYITPVVTKTAQPVANAPSAAAAVTGTATLDWAAISAELGTGASVEPLVVAPAETTAAVTTLVTTATGNSTGASLADGMWTATASQDRTAAATIGATGAVVTGAGSRAVGGVGARLVMSVGVVMSIAAFFFGIS